MEEVTSRSPIWIGPFSAVTLQGTMPTTARGTSFCDADSSTLRVVPDRKSTRLNSSHVEISYAVFCLKKKKQCPQREVHQQIIQRLLQACNKCHAPLNPPKCALEFCDLAFLVARSPTCQEVLHTLNAIHNMCVQLGPQGKLALPQATSKHPGQQWHSKTCHNEECQGRPGQYGTEEAEQAKGKQSDCNGDN